jgi:Lon protease-like protein
MRRDLPPRPNLEHLKKQAKDLLDAHQRGEAEALGRIRAAVPSFAGMSDEAIARAPFALHDAQSAIAREHGLKSWHDLREAVAAMTPEAPPSEALLRALMGQPLPESVRTALGDAWARRAEAAAGPGLPGALPLVAMRNALLVPGALAPIHVGRTSSRAAIDAALAATPPLIAVFAQRAADTEEVTAESLHSIGCEAIVHTRIPDGEQRAWVILEGVRWVALQSLEPVLAGYAIARVTPVPIEEGEAGEVSARAEELRATARTLASALPDGARLVAMLDALKDPRRLADLVIANLPVTVEEKARYAAEPRLPERLRIAHALAEVQLASTG